MANPILEKSLCEALSRARLSELPDEYQEGSKVTWVKAIALVKKRDCSMSYCIVRNDIGKPAVVTDFGSQSIVVSFEKIYPFQFMQENDVPVFTSKKQIEAYLVANGDDVEDVKRLLSTKNDDGTKKTAEQREIETKEINNRVIRFAASNAAKK